MPTVADPEHSAKASDADELSRQANRSVARGGVINAIGNLVGVLEPLYLVVISRMLGADVIGGYVLATTWVSMLLYVGVMGLDKGMLRFVPLALQAPSPGPAQARVVGTALRFAIALSVTAVVVVSFFADRIAGVEGGQLDAGWWLGWLILALPAEACVQILLFALRGRQDMTSYVLVRNLVLPLLLFVVGVPLVLAGFGKVALVIAYLVAAWGGLAATVLFFAHRFRGVRAQALAAAPVDREIVSFALPQGVTDILNQVLGRIDLLMLAFFFPDRPELLAVYAVAAMVAASVKKVRLAFDTSFAPVFSGLIATGNREALQRTYAQVARWVYLLFLVLAAAVSLGAPAILWSFGPEYPAYWLVVPILAFGRLANSAAGPSASALLMAGHSRLELINNALINVVNVALNYLLIPIGGVFGAAAATSIALTVFNVIRLFQLKRHVGVTPDGSSFVRITLAGTLAIVPSALLLGLAGATPLLSVAAVILFLVCYPLTLGAVGMGADLREAWSFFRKPKAERRRLAAAGTGASP